MTRHIYIVGMPGCGKSTFGKKLAKALKTGFTDLDKHIEKEERKSIQQLFSELGEEKFRELERLYLMETLKFEERTVVSTGGGTPCFFDNMKWMNDYGQTLYIDVDTEVLFERIARNKQKRPLFASLEESEMREKLYNLLEIREPYYKHSSLIIRDLDYKTKTLSIDFQEYMISDETLKQIVDF